MKIENQVCTYEQAIKLMESGINIASLYRWYFEVKKKTGEQITPILSRTCPFDLRTFNTGSIPAYTTAELGVMLPEELIHSDSISDLIQWTYCEKGFIIDFRLIYKNNGDPNKTFPEKPIYAKTEAEARAKLLIYLLDVYKYPLDLIQRRCQFIM